MTNKTKQSDASKWAKALETHYPEAAKAIKKECSILPINTHGTFDGIHVNDACKALGTPIKDKTPKCYGVGGVCT